MKNWYESSVKTLQLNGKGERSQQSYTRAVSMLTEFYDKTPDHISEEELQEYFLHHPPDIAELLVKGPDKESTQ